MGSFKLIFLIPFFSFSQTLTEFTTKYNSEVHFYSAFAINDLSYHVQSWSCPKWSPTKKILVSNGITLVAIFGKEFYDTKKKKPTGFSWDDALIGCWSIPVYDIVRICINDHKKRNEYSFESKRLLVY